MIRPFGEIAVARGLVTTAQVDAALDEQEQLVANGAHEHLGELLVGQGLLTPKQVHQVLELQGKRMLFCPECFAHFNVREYSADAQYRCRKCGETLITVDSGDGESSTGRSSSRIEMIEVDSQLSVPPLAGRTVLRVESGTRAGSEFRLAEGETLHVGSRDDVDIYLPDKGIRPLHCKIRSNGLDVILFDYEAVGGTKVNGSPVDFLHLRNGDELTVGSVQILVLPWSEDPAAEHDGPAEMPKREVLLGRALLDRGLVTKEQIQSALQEQDRRRIEGQPARLGELLVEQGLVTEHQIKTALAGMANRRLHVKCPECGMSFNLRQEDLGSQFPCFGCGKELRVPKNPLLLRTAEQAKRGETGKRRRPQPTRESRVMPRETQPVDVGEFRARFDAEEAAKEAAEEAAEIARQAESDRVERALAERDTREVPRPQMPEGDSSSDQSLILDLTMEVPLEEEEYCQIAYSGRYVTMPQLEAGLQILNAHRARGEVGVSLGRILVEKRYITPAHHQVLLEKLGLRVADVDIPGYQLVRKLGEGASGTVYQALQLAGRRPVAMKIVRPELQYDERFVRRFYREAELAMRLKHPNVVGGLDVGQHGRHMYMVMELFVGETIEDYLMREQRMSERYTLEVGYQVSLALAHANSHSLIHRDVKPGNIVLDTQGVAKLIDLGLAKSVSGGTAQSVTQTGLILGTPNFISPEQARGEAVIDHRTDIYSLGSSLYNMVTGQLPFRGNSPLDTMMMHLNDDPPPPREVQPDVSRVFSKMILRMMAKDPNDRIQTWEEIAGKLETLLQR